jgi:hypothetical protein
VEIGVLEADVPAGQAREVPWEEAHAHVRAGRDQREPWQREDATLANYGNLRGVVTDDGAAVFRVGGDGRTILLQATGDEPASRELLAALRVHGPVTVFNVPTGDPLLDAFRSLGGKITIRQREMTLAL